MIIDAHIHLWNRLHGTEQGIDREALRWGQARQNGRIYYATPPAFEDSLSTYERALAHMEWLGIDRAVVLQELIDGKQDDYLAQVRRECPQRFSCMALFDRWTYEDPMAAFAEAIEAKRLQGYLVKTPDPFSELAISRLIPLWQACAERGLPIVLKNGAPADIVKLVTAVPTLKVVLSHFAGALGNGEEHEKRLAIAAEYENVFIDTGGLNHLRKHPWPKSVEQMHHAVERVGANKIAWGSDYPRPTLVADASYKQQLQFITELCTFLSDEQREQILSGTALRVYKWDD
ncbi:MAG: amidohydrolase [Chloroflexi bacterium]|nr:amidohydrolase [Chloroflexota bacterium]